MARFFRYKKVTDALHGIESTAIAIKNFRMLMRKQQSEEDTLFNLVTIIAMVSLAHSQNDDEGEKQWNGKLKAFIRSLDKDARALTRHFANQQLAIAEAHRLGASNAEIATALKG